MYVNYLHNPFPYFIHKVCCDDTGVQAQHNEKPKGIRRGTITIPKGLGFRIKTALTEVSRLLRKGTAIVSDIERYLIRLLNLSIFYITLKEVDDGYQTQNYKKASEEKIEC